MELKGDFNTGLDQGQYTREKKGSDTLRGYEHGFNKRQVL